MSLNPTPCLLAPSQAAKRASVSYRTIQRLVRAQEFPQPVRVSKNRIAFHESEVDAWIAERPRATEAA